MKYYAIQNKITGRFVAGTDFNYDGNHRQLYANEDRPPRLFPVDPVLYGSELARRGIKLERFRLVEIEIEGRAPRGKIDTHTREGVSDA